jgi:ABC-type glycerol-3-phosphate transport system substrate-binding protein
MNKKLTKLLSIALAVGMVGSTLVACAPTDDPSSQGPGNKFDADIDLAGKDAANDPNTIECYVYSAGYGVNWLNACAKEFMRLYPEYKIVAQSMPTNSTLRSKLATGPDFTADLLIIGDSVNGVVSEGASVYSGYPVIMENLDDVYNSVPLTDTGSVKLKDKMDAASVSANLQTVTINGNVEQHYYQAPWTNGYSGLFYNTEMFQTAGITKEPRTTQELLNACEALKSKSITPIIMSSADDYVQYLSMVWWAQYEGQEGIENFYYCRESTDAYPTADGRVFDQVGFYEMFKVYEEFLGNNNTNGLSESLNYTDAQRFFLKGDATRLEHGAMMPNGNWLENEMSNTSTTETVDKISMMSTPVMSALVAKLSFWNEGNKSYSGANLTAQQKAAYDEKLCAIIDYVDGVSTTKPAFATDADIEFVREARSYYLGGGGSALAVPVFATAKEGAKKFISFMGSDKAISLYFQNTHGCTLPYAYDYSKDTYYSEISSFAKKVISLSTGRTAVISADSYITGYKGGFNYEQGLSGNNFAITFASRDAASRKTADQVITDIKTFYKTSTLTAMLQRCGLIL